MTRFFGAILLLLAMESHAQQAPIPPVTANPDSAVFYTADIDNFWKAFDAVQPGSKTNPFDTGYIKKGSPGVQAFLGHNRIVNADTLLATVRLRKADYLKARPGSLGFRNIAGRCRPFYYALKYLYPEAVFPPVYFVVGRFNTGGTITPEAQIVAAEMNGPDNMPYIIAHELIHANQQIPYKYRILLEQCTIEGSADFLGELISGRIAGEAPYRYARGKEEQIRREFIRDMNFGENDDFSYWLYGSGKGSRPADMGYYVGYTIARHFYNKATDKRVAIRQILNIEDCKQFLEQSGYLTDPLTSEPGSTVQAGKQP